MIFGQKVLKHKPCILIFSTILSEINLIVKTIQQVTVTRVRWSSRKLPLFLSDMEWGLKSLDRFSKNSRTSYFMKIYPVESNFPCRRTDRRKWGNSWSVFAILWKHIKQLLIITFRVQHRICILAKQLVLIFFIQTNKTPVNVRMCSPARDS